MQPSFHISIVCEYRSCEYAIHKINREGVRLECYIWGTQYIIQPHLRGTNNYGMHPALA